MMNMQLSKCGLGIEWKSAAVQKKNYVRNRSVSTEGGASSFNSNFNRNGSIQFGANSGGGGGVGDVWGMYQCIPFSSISDIVLGSLSDGAHGSGSGGGSGGLSAAAVLSVRTAAHSLELELDTAEVPTASCYIGSETLQKINAAASTSLDSGSGDVRTTTASAFTRPSGMFSFGGNGDGEDASNKKNQQQLTQCPQIVTRHPFVRALRMATLIHGHMRMVTDVKRVLMKSGPSGRGVAVPNQTEQASPSRSRPTGMRLAERAREKVVC
jgi:hypothetical protein